MKDYISFAPTITINKEFLASNLAGAKPKEYRLYSVVEHVGEWAHRGHYICYSMDAEDEWLKFDDGKVSVRSLDSVLDNT
jgi:ubiquitin C-terminal hydrolase